MLPEDPQHWPADPYALLGVQPGDDLRVIKKAYAALIRRFKPEQYPVQFQRIREAFEQVQETESWRTKYAQPPRDEWAAPSPQADAPHTWWDDACTGQHLDVYRRLRERALGQPTEIDLLQLYWLRVAFPEVDLDIHPIEWLLKALVAGFEAGPAVVAVETELHFRPELFRNPAFVRMLSSIRAPQTIARLSQCRWRAALRLKQWDAILADIDPLRERLFDQPQLWVNALVWLLGHLAWDAEEHVQRAFRKTRDELERCASGSRELDFVADRIDFLAELALQWRRMPRKSPLAEEISTLTPIAWSGSTGEVRWHLHRVFRAIAKNIDESLAALDMITLRAPLVVAQAVLTAQQTYFGTLGRHFGSAAEIDAAFLEFRSVHTNNPPRRVLCDFFAREQLLVDDVLGAVDFRAVSAPVQALLTRLSADNPLRLVVFARLTVDE